MTQADFEKKYWPRLLFLATESWALRKELPSDVGFMMDRQLVAIKATLREMYTDAQPPETLPLKQQTPTTPGQQARQTGTR